MSLSLPRRMRRNRSSAPLRALVRETTLTADDLIQPLFVRDGEPEPVASMPGVTRHSLASLIDECGRCAAAGIRAVAIFPCIPKERKDARGECGLADDNVLFAAVAVVKRAQPGLLVIADVALDPYADHGHDGILDASGGDVANDETVEVLCRLAVREAQAGADIVAPSDMMDGRIGAVRAALDAAGFERTLILSYAAKYASAYYGPFRDAVGSGTIAAPPDKRGYQMDPANIREAALEAQLDEDEGADIVMVKPAGPYLDVIRAVREATALPLAAYQVSGEYAQIHAASHLGWLDYERTRDESLLAIKRAGADMILTYFAREVAEAMRGDRRGSAG
ncbi:MAG: porphobilinogen synthase [Terrimicrobiaceae bacterium]|nr:porphobilinogen synthase [Terrimicrobiaceae bacterium]